MYQRLLVVFLLSFLAFGSATAQEPGVLRDPNLADAPARTDTRPANSFELKGVLISGLTRTALVNGRPVQEGGRVGGAEILEIEQHGILVRVGSWEFKIDVGSTFVAEQSSSDIAMASRKPARDGSTPSVDVQLPHEVKSGETLSGIALRYRKDGVTMYQMMIALYQSNPNAFRNNINALREGAVLRIPDENEVRLQTRAMAAAEVARHTDRWQAAGHHPVRFADSSLARQYGPVESGETLSAIASRVSHDGFTMNQMMVALYQSNPQAFGSNINVLLEGAVLTIPAEMALRRQPREVATAEVVRQTKAWRMGIDHDALSTLEHLDIMASTDGPLD